MKSCPAKKGDYFEFFAELDILAALSTCPGGDLSIPLWGPNARDPLEVCRPLGVEVYKVHQDTYWLGITGESAVWWRAWPSSQTVGSRPV